MHTKREKDTLLKRVNRIRGQVDAIERALSSDKEDCAGVLQTIAACRGAINGLMAEVMEGHMREHVLSPKLKPSEEQREAAEDIIQLINRYLK